MSKGRTMVKGSAARGGIVKPGERVGRGGEGYTSGMGDRCIRPSRTLPSESAPLDRYCLYVKLTEPRKLRVRGT